MLLTDTEQPTAWKVNTCSEWSRSDDAIQNNVIQNDVIQKSSLHHSPPSAYSMRWDKTLGRGPWRERGTVGALCRGPWRERGHMAGDPGAEVERARGGVSKQREAERARGAHTPKRRERERREPRGLLSTLLCALPCTIVSFEFLNEMESSSAFFQNC